MPAKPLPGPSRLSTVLKTLQRQPKPTLTALKSLTLSLSANRDFGARHFLKEDIPRIRYANPELNVQVKKVSKPIDRLKSEMALEFKDGRKMNINVSQKWSVAIFEEMMDNAGGDRWQRFKDERQAAAQAPVIPTWKPKSRPTQAAHTPATPNPSKTGAAAVLP